MAHVQNRGDLWAMVGTWLGEAGSKLAIEGIALAWISNVPGVSYQAVLLDGTLTDFAYHGEFLGTRGCNIPICGFQVNLDDAAAEHLVCHYSATFTDGARVGPLSSGQRCQATSLSPLEVIADRRPLSHRP